MRPRGDLRLRFTFGARNPVVRGVALNVTVTGARKPGCLRVWDGWSSPIVSSVLNHRVGGSVATMVLTSTEVNDELGTSTTGWPSIGIANGSAGEAHLVVDVVGVWTDLSVPGYRFAAMAPARVLDTRTGTGAYAGPIGPAGSCRLRPRVPGATGEVAAVVATMTTIRSTRSTYLTRVGRDDEPTDDQHDQRPRASAPGQLCLRRACRRRRLPDLQRRRVDRSRPRCQRGPPLPGR